MKRILAVILFFAAATSLALGQTADKQEKTKGDKSWLRLVDHLYFVADHDDHHLARIWELVNAARREQSVRDLVVGIGNESPPNLFSRPLAREVCLTVMESERPAKERTWPQLG
jgi:hypothetical protein